MTEASLLVRSWLAIIVVSALAVIGEVLIAAGMRQLGDLDDIRAKSGLGGEAKTAEVVDEMRFLLQQDAPSHQPA